MESRANSHFIESYPSEVGKFKPANSIGSGNAGASFKIFSELQPRMAYACQSRVANDPVGLNISAASVPLVKLVETCLFFEGQFVDFGRQNLMIKLFAAFLERPQCRVSRLDLIKQIYGHDNLAINNRRVLSDFHNIVKLISRARKICEQNFSTDPDRSWVWFDYDPFACEWVLIKPRHVRMNLHQDL